LILKGFGVFILHWETVEQDGLFLLVIIALKYEHLADLILRISIWAAARGGVRFPAF